MKKLIAAVLTAGTLGAGVASAAEISGNVTLTSDYRFRGISQNTGEISPALQGGFDLATDSGFYIGTWGSNVNFSNGSLELDIYAGFAGEFGEGLAYDIGYLYYAYPKDGPGQDLDYYEVYGSLGFAGFTFGVNYSPDYFAETGKFWYLYGDYSLPLGENFSLDLHVGYNGFDEEDFLGNGNDEYYDFSVGVSTSAMGVDWSAAVIGTDLDDDADCFGAEELCEPYVVLSVSKSL